MRTSARSTCGAALRPSTSTTSISPVLQPSAIGSARASTLRTPTIVHGNRAFRTRSRDHVAMREPVRGVLDGATSTFLRSGKFAVPSVRRPRPPQQIAPVAELSGNSWQRPTSGVTCLRSSQTNWTSKRLRAVFMSHGIGDNVCPQRRVAPTSLHRHVEVRDRHSGHHRGFTISHAMRPLHASSAASAPSRPMP